MSNTENFVSLDMEYNQPTGTIISIGLTVFNINTGEVLEKFHQHIKVKEQISEFITKLTGIKQEDCDNGVSLEDCYKEIVELCKKHGTFRNPVTWGGGDSIDLRKALNLNDESFVWGCRWIDAKTLFVSWCLSNNLKTQSGLSKSLIRLGLNFVGRKHNALDDSYNTMIIYRKLLEKFKEVKNV